MAWRIKRSLSFFHRSEDLEDLLLLLLAAMVVGNSSREDAEAEKPLLQPRLATSVDGGGLMWSRRIFGDSCNGEVVDGNADESGVTSRRVFGDGDGESRGGSGGAISLGNNIGTQRKKP